MLMPVGSFLANAFDTMPIRCKQSDLWDLVLPATPKKWPAIREIYRLQHQIDEGHYSPYFMPWPDIFTPIERYAWEYIRCLGLPMYPQYPVGQFFVDFGDPKQRIAIECDGAEFHRPGADAERDAILRGLGWTVHRFTGSELYRTEARHDAPYERTAQERFNNLARDCYGKTIWTEDVYGEV